MAGRGRRVGNDSEPEKIVGTAVDLKNEEAFDDSTLVKNISEINLENNNVTLLQVIESIFKKLCTSETALKNTITNLYNKALEDLEFGDKFVVAIQQIINIEVESSTVRKEFLSAMEAEFKLKETVSQTNKTRFFNAITFLGSSFHSIKIQGSSFWIFGFALLDYLEFLLKEGKEEEMKVLIKQLILNYDGIIEVSKLAEKFKLLEHNLRYKIINTNESDTIKYWCLLTLELIINHCKPLSEPTRDFYTKNLTDGYSEIEAYLITVQKNKKSLDPVDSVKHETDKTNTQASPEIAKHQTENERKSFDRRANRAKDETRMMDKFVDMNLNFKPNNNLFKDLRNLSSGQSKTVENKSLQKKQQITMGHFDKFDARPQRTVRLDHQRKNKDGHKDFNK
ncbi:hypothetical protein RUM44_006843 [Polyplax serrata]|uniref:Uncharacterized protein n=1 Tax=Polyplax serrata TaxID=468196 RepID=A0ABR1AKR6_POLSC